MKSHFFITAIMLFISLTGCASRALPELSDTWRPANNFDEAPRVIALFRPYTYQVLSVDSTLMQLVRRWAKDTNLNYDYRCDDDFSLPAKLEGKIYRELDVALDSINEVYDAFGINFSFSTKRILVVTCGNRDVITGVSRLKRSDKLNLNITDDNSHQSKNLTKVIE